MSKLRTSAESIASRLLEIFKPVRGDMSVRIASDLTVAELKEELRKLGLSSTGNKNELVMRLNKTSPSGMWTDESSMPQEVESAEAVGLEADERDPSVLRKQMQHLRDKSSLREELNELK